MRECCCYSEINADVVDDIANCTEDDCNNDNLMRSAITGIGTFDKLTELVIDDNDD